MAYTVRFVRNSDGKDLSPAVTYYGNVGDKPVVACKIIDGYYPQYYNITGTLSENAAENQFVFRYAPVPTTVLTPTPQPTEIPTPVPTLRPGETPQTATLPPATAAPATTPAPQTETTSEPETFPPQPEDILDLDVPLAEPGENAENANHAPLVGIGLGAIGAVALALWYVFVFRKKKNDEAE